MAVCSKCGASIIWMKTKDNKKMPVDYRYNIVNDELYNKDKHTSHWVTCKFVDEFKKERKK